MVALVRIIAAKPKIQLFVKFDSSCTGRTRREDAIKTAEDAQKEGKETEEQTSGKDVKGIETLQPSIEDNSGKDSTDTKQND